MIGKLTKRTDRLMNVTTNNKLMNETTKDKLLNEITRIN